MVEAAEYKELREFERIPLRINSTITLDGRELPCMLLNFCAGGAKIRLSHIPVDDRVSEGYAITLTIPNFDGFDGAIAWTDDEYLGIRFDENHKAMSALVTASAESSPLPPGF